MNEILQSLLIVIAPMNILFILIGVFIGIVFGAIPGLTGGVAIVILLPMTFSMDPMSGILLLLGIYNGSTYGGSISAILIGTPGTAGGAATVVDGFSMAKRGLPNKALNAALYASTFGGLVGSLLLLFAAPLISDAAIKLGPPEYFAIALLGLAIVAGVGGKNPFTGFICAGLGLLCSSFGMSSLSGTARFTFDSVAMLKGFGTLPMLLGIFALTLIMKGISSDGHSQHKEEHVKVDSTNKADVLTVSEFMKTSKVLVKSSIIGSLIGAIPGAGVVIASFLSYTEAKRSSKHPEKFGTGVLEGIIAPETANNAVCATSFVPLLTLGIPGSVVAAILLGALTMQGIIPGPLMIAKQGIYFYGIIFGFIIIQFFMLLEGKVLLNVFKKVVDVPTQILMPMLMVFCLIGSFAAQNRLFDVGVLVIVGFVYYWLQKFGASGPPFVLGFILGPIVEFHLDGAIVMGGGSWMIFITRPVCLVFLIFSILIFIVMYRQNRKIEETRKTMKPIIDGSQTGSTKQV